MKHCLSRTTYQPVPQAQEWVSARGLRRRMVVEVLSCRQGTERHEVLGQVRISVVPRPWEAAAEGRLVQGWHRLCRQSPSLHQPCPESLQAEA